MPEAGHQARRGLIGAELVEAVDADGQVTAIVTRAAIRAENRRHRATYVVVRDRDGAVLVHRRAPWKDIWPHRWDIAFGGLCEVGESWSDGAIRELQEEAGVAVAASALVDRGPVRFESSETRVIGRVFFTVHDGPFTFRDGEVVDHAWVPASELSTWLSSHELCGDSVAVVVPAAVAIFG